MRRGGSIVAVVMVLAGTGCATSGSAPAHRPGSGPAAAPLALHWVRDSAEYRAATVQAYRMATRRIDVVGASMPPGTWAVSLDADETVLDNSQYQKERAAAGLAFTPESWREWVSRKSAPAIPGAKAFLRRVKELKGTIFIVTNRRQAECADTEANFQALELPYDAILCRPDDGPGEKEPRYDSIAAGTAVPGLRPLEVVLWVGDNIMDFPQLRQEMRKAGETAFMGFGGRFIIIPNPMYGSWESNPAE
jgi:5'-nucleotidase (lipoprotein e(P4) family)